MRGTEKGEKPDDDDDSLSMLNHMKRSPAECESDFKGQVKRVGEREGQVQFLLQSMENFSTIWEYV
jgi:hypothetical protein